MALPFYNWSRTAATNATADSTVNWQEGQAPSTVNDSARSMMASTAAFRDDISTGTLAGGTNNAITLSTYQIFDTLAHLANQLIGFRASNTNTAATTLSVDGLTAKPLRYQSGVDLPAGTILGGTPYQCVYNLSDDVFYLIGIIGQPYSVPIGGLIDFTGTTAPNSSFVLPYGQAISRSTYSTYFGMVSTTYGTGDGSTTFNVPDLRGRVIAGKDDMGGSVSSPARLTATYFGAVTGAVGTTLGGIGGLESHTLTTAQIAAHNHSVTDPGHGHPGSVGRVEGNAGSDVLTAGELGKNNGAPSDTQILTIASNTTGISIQNTGGGGAHNNVQPTIILNKLLRII